MNENEWAHIPPNTILMRTLRGTYPRVRRDRLTTLPAGTVPHPPPDPNRKLK